MTTPYYRECLTRELSQRLKQNPQYSMRAFARSLQIPVSSLSRALAGKRTISVSAATKIAANLGLSPRERALFFASIGTECGPKGRRSTSNAGLDQTKNDVHDVDEETFRAIADWHHYAILEMTYLKGFRPEPRWLAARLGISPLEASMAVARLERLGLIKREGTSIKKTKRTIWSHGALGQSSAALKLHQKQCLTKALDAIDAIPFDQRTSSAMTMPIDPGKLPLARRLIEEFAVDLCRTLSSRSVSDVYQLTISFHSLLRKGEDR